MSNRRTLAIEYDVKSQLRTNCEEIKIQNELYLPFLREPKPVNEHTKKNQYGSLVKQ